MKLVTEPDAPHQLDPLPAEDAKMTAIMEAEAAITEADGDVRDAESEVDEAKANLKLVEKKREDAVQHLRDVIRGRDSQAMPLFDQAKPTASDIGGANAAAPPDQTDESWRQVPISELDLKPGTAKALTEANLTTIGAIADYTSADKQLDQIKGLGEAKVAQIDDALAAFWKRWAEKGVVVAKPAERSAKLGQYKCTCGNEWQVCCPADEELTAAQCCERCGERGELVKQTTETMAALADCESLQADLAAMEVEP